MEPPQDRIDAYEAQLRRFLTKPGWMIQAVAPAVGQPSDTSPFAYTVGLWHNYNHPEILVSGWPMTLAQWVLNELGRRVRDGDRLQPGIHHDDVLQPAEPGIVMPVQFVWVDPPHYRDWRPFVMIYGRNPAIDLLQMVWPDRVGKLPWDDGYDGTGFHQDLLGAP